MSQITNDTIEFIKKHEGSVKNSNGEHIAYKDAVGVWTIGYGNTFYPDGKKVRNGDKISENQAVDLLNKTLTDFSNSVNKLLKVKLNNCQYGAVLSFTYNLGKKNLEKSTLLKKINKNPSDPTIRDEFKRWVYAGGRKLAGLVTRRNEEADYYFNSKCNIDTAPPTTTPTPVLAKTNYLWIILLLIAANYMIKK